MKFERDEIIGMAVSVVIAVALFAALRFDLWSSVRPDGHEEGVKDTLILKDAIVLEGEGDMASLLARAFSQAGNVEKLVVQDVVVGEGPRIEKGSRVEVHYIGMLKDGKTFKNTYESGEPYRFTVGMGDVIEGWDQGLMGMREGGERILVVPAKLGYGSRTLDGVPPNSTLLFSIELISVE